MTNPFINDKSSTRNTLDKIKTQPVKKYGTKTGVLKGKIVYLFQQRWFRKFLVFFVVFIFGVMIGSGSSHNSSSIEKESSKYSISSNMSDEQKTPNLSGLSIAQSEQILDSLGIEYKFSEKIDVVEDWIIISSEYDNYSSELILNIEKTPERLEKEAEEERLEIEEMQRLEAEKQAQEEQERIQAEQERIQQEEAQRIEEENRRVEIENNRVNNFVSAPQETPGENTNAPFKATCKDGSHSESEPGARDYRGMCSGHGGILTKHGR